MSVTTLTSKGQITIPKSIRDFLRLSQGDKIEMLVTENQEVILRPVTKKVDDVLGLLKKYQKEQPISVEEMEQTVKQRLQERFS